MEKTLPPRFGQLRLRDLMLLEHLDALGSLTETAAQMHVTQSAITQALQSLEQAFGHTLVERGRRGQRGVRLTPSGSAALARLRVARHELLEALGAAAAPDTVRLRVGTLPTALIYILPKVLARLRQRLPQVHVELSESTIPVLWRQLEAGELDAIVCGLPALNEQKGLPLGVALRPIATEKLVLVCAKTHPLARKRKPRVEDLLQHPWVLQPHGSFTRLIVDQMFMNAGLKGPPAAITSMNFHANLRFVASCGLLAIAPLSAVQPVAKELGLAILHPERYEPGAADVVLAWRESGAGHPALRALQDCF